MEIINTDSRIRYLYTCERCNSTIAIYPNDVKHCDYEIVGNTLNRRMHLICPICGSDIIIYLDDTPCFFKQWMARLRGWKHND